MAGNIKGITIEFNGDTTKLDKALRQINKETRDIDKELKQVDKALKFNPTSVELWRQKQTLLTQKVEETKKKLDALKQAQQKMDADGVDKNSEEYRKLQREIIVTGNQVKTFEGQLRKVGNVNLRAASEQFKVMGDKLTAAGHAMQGLSTAAAAVAASIGAITVKSASWADDINTMSKVYGIGTDELQKYSAAADLVDVDVETIAKSHSKLTKAMSAAKDETSAQAEAFQALGVDVVDANGNLRDADTVWQETIAALGNVSNETERDALAMTLMSKSAQELNPLIEDGGEAYKNLADTLKKYDLDYIDQEMLDNANAFNDSLDTIKAVGTVAFQQVGTQLAAYLAPAMERVVDLVGQIAGWFANLSPETQAMIATIAGVVAILAPLLLGLGKLSFAISSIMSLMSVLGPALGGILSTLGPIVIAIAAVIAIGVLLYKNWDTIKAYAVAAWNSVKTTITNAVNNAVASVKTMITNLKTTLSNAWTSIKSSASSAWNSIKEKITSPFQSAKDTISGIIDKIKGWFPIKLGNLFSGLKLPHFSLGWATKDFGKLGSVSYPTGLNVNWYAQGGIFNSPTIAGIGDAPGGEAVVPLDKFWDKLDRMQGGETNIVININGANRDPREIAEEVRRVLVRETNQRRMAWQ